MNSKKFEYTNRDLPYLKKDIIFRTIFAVLFLMIFTWQFIAFVKMSINKSTTLMHIISAIVVFICCLMLTFISLLYVFKDFRIISAVKLNGRCVSSVQILIKTNKKSFIWLYSLLIQLLTLITAIVLICSITYSILQITYFSTISFYLPFLLTICVSGFNSIYHIKDEMHIQNTVQEFQSA